MRGLTFFFYIVLHWHIIDETTFGIEMEKHPRLHRNQLWYYSKDEIRKVVQYATENAVRVVPEVNPFSHAASWKVLKFITLFLFLGCFVLLT